MADQYIKLDFANLSLQFTRVFFDSELPRKNDEVIELARSAYGAFYVKRRVYEEYHKWQFSTLISWDNKKILDAMFWEHNYRVRVKQTSPNPNILLTDCTRTFSERYPRTRAKAGGDFATENVFGSSPQFVEYYAKYWVFFEQEPQYTKQDEKLRVQLNFIEVNEKVTPIIFDGEVIGV